MQNYIRKTTTFHAKLNKESSEIVFQLILRLLPTIEK